MGTDDAGIIIPKTGNGLKSHDRMDGFLEVSGGDGNTAEDEVHLLMRNNSGEFAQGWFRVSELRAALDTIA